MKKRTLSLALALMICLGLTTPSLALPNGVATVRADSLNGYGDGILTAVQNGKYGFYKADGTQVAAPTYADAKNFSDGMAAVSATGSMQTIDETFEINAFVGGKYGYVDASGKLAIPMKYAKAFDFSEDRAFVRETEDGPLLMIDKTGKVIASYDNVDLWFYETVQFSEGLAILPIQNDYNGEDYYIAVDKTGKTVYTFEDAYVDFEHGYQNGLVAVAENGYWGTGGPCLERGFNDMIGAGYRDKTGKKVISTDYDEICEFVDGIAAVGKVVDDPTYYVLHYGFIDTSGKEVIPVKYSSFVTDSGDIRAVINDQNMRAYVDKSGREITGFLYEGTWGFYEGLSLVRAGNTISVIDTSGKTVFTSDNCDRGYSYTDGLSVMWNSETGKRGVYDKTGNLVIPFQYDGANVIDGFLWLQSGGTWTVYRVDELDAPADPQPSLKTANPSNDKLTVNGAEATPTVYNIDNSNYFKIRDVAALLNGTEKQFSVGYDGEKQSVTATTGQGYDKLPTDLAGAPAGAGEAKASGDAIYVNGAKITPEVYNINGNNYFKLRDLGEALDFYIGWSLERGVYIETDKPYAG